MGKEINDKIMTEKQHRILDRAARILLLIGGFIAVIATANFAIYLKTGAELSVRLFCWAAVFGISGIICTAVESAED